MKKSRFLKRVVAMLLVLVMGTSGALQTVSVYAAETVSTQVEGATDSSADESTATGGSTSTDGVSLEDNMTVTGTNGFGNLLADALSTETKEQAQNNGYNVFSIEMSGNTATVDMEALGDCTLIVALYDNDGKVMLTSNATEVTKDTKEAKVQLEATMIPQYYYLRAFLVDTITYQPMCTMYESNLYTEAMQAFLAKTTDDFDQDKVLNLDDDKTNNFAVFSDTTKLIPTVDGVNNLVSVDDATGTYTFENVDSNITSLTTGDIFAYEYNGELYIVKVASISVSGSVATIVEGETSMEDVFEYVKIDTTITEMQVKDDGVESDVDEVSQQLSESISTEESKDDSLEIMPEKELTDVSGTLDSGEWELNWPSPLISGSIKARFICDVTVYYESNNCYYANATIDYDLNFQLVLKSWEGEKEIPLGGVYANVWGISLELKVSFIASVEVTFSFNGDIEGRTGYSIEKGYNQSKAKRTNLSTKPEFTPYFKLDGEFFFGLKLSADIGIIDSDIIGVGIYATFGIKIEAEFNPDGEEGEFHECEGCVGGNISLTIDLGCEVNFLNIEDLSLERPFGTITLIDCAEFYYSIDKNKFEWTRCPNYTYLVQVYAKDSITLKPIVGADVTFSGIGMNKIVSKTDEKGIAKAYLPEKLYSICLLNDKGEIQLGRSLRVSKRNFFNGSVTTIMSVAWNSQTGTGGAGNTDTGEEEKPVEPVVPVTPISNFEYTLLDDGTLEIKSWSGNVAELVIPSNVNGRNVTSIGASAFANSTSLKSVVISKSVKKIGKLAFNSCANLKSVELNNGLEQLGDYAFNECTSLAEIVIPNTLTKCFFPFVDCINLKNVSFEEGTVKVIDHLFAGSGVERIIISTEITEIGSYAFYDCDDLISVEIPESVNVIGEAAFGECDRLVAIDIPSSVTRIEKALFERCDGLISVSIPQTVTEIGGYAFQECRNLKYMEIPSTVTYIGAYAFAWCNNWTNVTIPTSIKRINAYAYSGCDGLTCGDIPESVSVIEEYAFSGCSGLTYINLPSAIRTIEMGTFSGCFNLTSINIPDSVSVIQGNAFNGCSGLTSIKLPSSLVRLGSAAFSGCDSLAQIEIPRGVKLIESRMFSYCENLVYVKLPESLSEIGERAFENCDKLTSIEIPKSVTKIGSYAFFNCKLLKNIDIPDAVKTMGVCVFQDCDALTEIDIPLSLEAIGDGQYKNCDGLSEVNIPTWVTIIGEGAFTECENLVKVNIPNTVTTIENSAFRGCISLKDINIPVSVTSIGFCAFQNCRSLEHLEIPDSVQKIEMYSFQQCKLSYVKLNNGLETIDKMAFALCADLIEVEIPASVNSIESDAFYGCYNLTKIVAYCAPSVLENALNFEGKNSALEVVYATTEPTTPFDMSDVTKSDVTSVVTTEAVLDEVSTPNETTQPNTDFTSVLATPVPQVSSLDLTSNSVTYTDLVPGQMYNFYIFKSEKADNIFADGNLVYVTQVTADENGSVTIAYTLDDIYCDVVLKLVSDGKVSIADTNISEVTGWKYDGYDMPPCIRITYDGKALVQGRDYHLSGDVVTDGMGIYNIKVTGDGSFTGEKSFRYIVTGDCVFGDGNGDNVVDIRDAVQLKQRIAGMDVDMNTYAVDVNADTEIDIKDAVKLMKFMAGFEDVVLGEAS